MEILDPLYGLISLFDEEKKVIDTPLFQRLRRIKQLGFTELTFPGATHNRYIHSIGTVFLASRAFSHIVKDLCKFIKFNTKDEKRILSLLRLSALLHDLGHPPLSHAAESFFCEQISSMKISHEDITLSLILSNEFKNFIDHTYRKLQISAEDIACILQKKEEVKNKIIVDGYDLTPLLHQLISGEVDVDRMDYLLRDSYYTGVKYGNFDKEWLISHLTIYEKDKKINLALNSKAIWTFEDFLLSRYHMFIMVYFHHKTVIYEKMLDNFLREEEEHLAFIMEDFVKYDDEWLMGKLKNSQNFWAKAIVLKKPFKMVFEVNEKDFSEEKKEKISAELKRKKIFSEWISSIMALSKYYGKERKSPQLLYVKDEKAPYAPKFYPVDEYTDLFKKYEEKVKLLRLYCEERNFLQVKKIVSQIC